jgi:hypothetical protein
MTEVDFEEKYVVPYPEGTLIRFVTSKQVFVIQNLQKRFIPSLQIFISHGYDFEDVKVMTNIEDFDAIEVGADLQ